MAGPLHRISATLAPLLIAAAALLWGTHGVVAKHIIDGGALDGLGVGFWRLAMASPALAILMLVLPGQTRWWAIERRSLPGLAAIGLTMALYQVTFYGAVAQIGVSLAVLIAICGAPPLVAILSLLLLSERPGPRTIIGLMLGLAGVGLIVGLPVEGVAARPLGLALAFGAALTYAAFTVAGRRFARDLDPAAFVVYGFAIGAVALAPLALLQGQTPARGDLAPLAFLALVPTALAYALYFRGMRGTEATTASVLTLMEPLAAVVLAAVLLGESLAPASLAGGALLILGVVLSSTPRRDN